MIKFILVVFLLTAAYYTLTYARSLWKDDQNKPGGAGAALLALLGLVVPVIVMMYF